MNRKGYFAINLNPFVVKDYEDKFYRGGARFNSEAEEIHGRGMMMLADELSKKYGISIDSVSSWAGLAFYANMSIENAQRVYSHESVASIEEINPKEFLRMENNYIEDRTGVANKNDTLNLDDREKSWEITSWAKKAVNTDDWLTTANSFYLVDGNFEDYSPIAYDVNVVAKFDSEERKGLIN